jgi:hypothetical protein
MRDALERDPNALAADSLAFRLGMISEGLEEQRKTVDGTVPQFQKPLDATTRRKPRRRRTQPSEWARSSAT